MERQRPAQSLAAYYWTVSKHVGARVWKTRGRELISALVLAVVTFVVSYMFRQVDALTAFEIAVLSLFGWLSIFALIHVIRAPVLLHDPHTHSQAVSLNWKFGILGSLTLILVCLIVAAVGAWWWIDREPRYIFPAQVLNLESENTRLRVALDASNANAEEQCEQAKGKEIVGLRKRFGQGCYLPDRRLTEENRDVLFHTLKKLKAANASIANINLCVEYPSDFDSANFAAQLKKVFQDAEWTVSPCDQETLKVIMRNSLWPGLVIIDSQRQGYASMEIQTNLLQMGIDVQPFYPEALLPDRFKGIMLLVGYKVGYKPS